MKRIINCETGEITQRELNKSEKDQQKIDQIANDAYQIIADQNAVKRQLILDKLGLTADEARLLLG